MTERIGCPIPPVGERRRLSAGRARLHAMQTVPIPARLMLTKRRAIDLCRVAAALCPRS
jgi:hypothetical protein